MQTIEEYKEAFHEGYDKAIELLESMISSDFTKEEMQNVISTMKNEKGDI